MVFVSMAIAATPALFGPISLNLPIETTGNPFDPRENDVRVYFQAKNGIKSERIAYFAHNKWTVRGYLPERGTYQITITQNGKVTKKLPNITITGKPTLSMVQTDGKWFKTANGTPFWPIGINTAWGADKNRTVSTFFPFMAKSGMNWARVWACHWDDRNPYWTTNVSKPKDNWMSEAALDRWDEVISSAEANNIKFQFVLFHHGQFSSSVNPNWPEHPWNAKNGGFLQSASDFFTDPEAKRRTKMMLRYFVARYGYSTSIMAWELFNEVQFVDRVRVSNDWKTVGQWHDEMASYIKSIDSNHHLVTTSSELDRPLWGKTDYMQGHGYPPSVAGMIAGTLNSGPQPMFYGEIGPGGNGNIVHDKARREGIWSAFFSRHSGAGQYWYWDQMNEKAFSEFSFSTSILKALPAVKTFVKPDVKVDVAMGNDLEFRPGRGWADSSLTTFNLPEDASPSKSGMLSSFIQGDANRKMQPKPLKFVFSSPGVGNLNIHIAEVSGNGGIIKVQVNGKTISEKEFKGQIHEPILKIPYNQGKNEIVIENIGKDWVNMDRFSFTGIAPQATIEAVRSGSIVVLHALTQKPGTEITLSNLDLTPARMNVTSYDLDGMTKTVSQVKLGKNIKLTLNAKDQIIILRK